MRWDDYGGRMHDGLGWGIGLVLVVLVVLFLLTLGVLAFTLLRGSGNGSGAGAGPGPSAPARGPADHLSAAEQLLAERYARGELDEEEYRHRREVLHSP